MHDPPSLVLPYFYEIREYLIISLLCDVLPFKFPVFPYFYEILTALSMSYLAK